MIINNDRALKKLGFFVTCSTGDGEPYEIKDLFLGRSYLVHPIKKHEKIRLERTDSNQWNQTDYDNYHILSADPIDMVENPNIQDMRDDLCDSYICCDRGKAEPDCAHLSCKAVGEAKKVSRRRSYEINAEKIITADNKDPGAICRFARENNNPEGMLHLLAIASGGYSQISSATVKDCAFGQKNNGGVFYSLADSAEELEIKLNFALSAYFDDEIDITYQQIADKNFY